MSLGCCAAMRCSSPTFLGPSPGTCCEKGPGCQAFAAPQPLDGAPDRDEPRKLGAPACTNGPQNMHLGAHRSLVVPAGPLDVALAGMTYKHEFYRLLGDVTGDGVVDNNDLNAIATEMTLSAQRTSQRGA